MSRENRSGLWTTCLYTFGCPELFQLSMDSAIKTCLERDDWFQKSRSELKDFFWKKLCFSWLYQLIARKNGRSTEIEACFETEIVSAFWIGWPASLLQVLEPDDLYLISRMRGMVGASAEFGHLVLKLRRLSHGGISHHNFVVVSELLHKRAVLVRTCLVAHADRCLVKPAEIIGFTPEGFAVVKTIALEMQNGELILCEAQKTVVNNFGFLVKIGDFISVHFGGVREVITQEMADNLRKITQKALLFFHQTRH